MPILMSVDNPEGHKLEELLAQLQRELKTRTSKLTGACPINETIRENNAAIIALLERAESFQRDTMRALESLGPDSGTEDDPRV